MNEDFHAEVLDMHRDPVGDAATSAGMERHIRAARTRNNGCGDVMVRITGEDRYARTEAERVAADLGCLVENPL